MRADVRHVKEYARLENEKAQLKEKLAAVEAKLGRLEEGVRRYFESQSLQKVTMEGRTLYLRRELWAKKDAGYDEARAVEALTACGLEDFAKPKPNWTSVSAYMRELEAEGQLDDEGRPKEGPLRGIFVGSEQFKIGSKKA